MAVLRVALLGLAVLSGGCSLTGSRLVVRPPRGRLYTHFRAPLIFDWTVPGGVESPPDLKVGIATTRTLAVPRTRDLASAAKGDMSLERAAREAGIRTIHYADYEMLNILGLYKRTTLYVYGR
jgi:hypothetical protein